MLRRRQTDNCGDEDDAQSAAGTSGSRGAGLQHKDIAVTLWTPHGAYEKYDLRKLTDPKKAMSAKEDLWDFAHEGFGQDHPLAAQVMQNKVLHEKQMLELEDVMVQKYDDKQPDKAVAEWLDKHPGYADKVIKGELTGA